MRRRRSDLWLVAGLCFGLIGLIKAMVDDDLVLVAILAAALGLILGLVTGAYLTTREETGRP